MARKQTRVHKLETKGSPSRNCVHRQHNQPAATIVDMQTLHSLSTSRGQACLGGGTMMHPSRLLVSKRRIQPLAVRAGPADKLAESKPGHTKLGFAGLGIMGVAMTRNLLKSGYEVHVWNRDSAKVQLLVQEGAKAAASPKDLAAASDYTFAMLADPPAALAVATGDNGIVQGLQPGKGYVDVSTVDAATSSSIAQAVRERGAAFLEAPVSGSKKPAEDGTLIFLTAGDEALFKAVAHPLEVMGKASFFLGEVGAGANMKLVVNMIMGSMMVAFAEGLSLAEKSGLKQKDLLDVMGLGAIAAPMYAMKGPSMIAGNYPPAFPLKHQQKDMRLALALGDETAQALPVAAAANASYVRARSAGLGDMDFSAVLQVVLEAHKSS